MPSGSSDAIVRVFAENGDRTNRAHARMKYVLDAWGFDKFLAAVEEKLGAPLQRLDGVHVAPRPAYDRLGHIGVHPQAQPGLNYIGVALESRAAVDRPDAGARPRSRGGAATATSASPSGRTC